MITVKELIEKLQEFPPETRVIVCGYEGGVDDITGVELTFIDLNVNTAWYYGKHEIADGENGVPAIHLI